MLEQRHNSSDLLSRDETAARLRISTRTLDALTSDGRGPPPTKIGGRVFFRLAEIEHFLETQTERAA